jgi:phospholipid/cholesterol/gamma-HCH transport system substrate-binding protein
MKQDRIEIFTGAVVILLAGFFLWYALHHLEHQKKKGSYEVYATFSNVDGLTAGSNVRLSGVKVGTISKIELNPETYLATLHIELEPNLLIPTDTVAAINTQGLLGDKYLSLEAGSDDEKIKAGGMIVNTQSSASIERLLGQVIFSLQNIGKAPAATPAPAPAPDAGAAPAAAHP